MLILEFSGKYKRSKNINQLVYGEKLAKLKIVIRKEL